MRLLLPPRSLFTQPYVQNLLLNACLRNCHKWISSFNFMAFNKIKKSAACHLKD